MNCEILKNGMAELGLPCSDEILRKFGVYYELLTEKNKVMNLTAITDEDEVSRLHFLDCLAIMKLCDFHDKKVMDIGSGAGFPGLPIKIADDSVNLTMMDALAKRIGFLSEVITAAGITNAEAVHGRAEEFSVKAPHRDGYDIAVSRAVARLSVLCELCMPFVKVGGVFIAMKSVNTEEEINEAKNAVKILGGKIEKVVDYPVPTTDVLHRAVIIRKTCATPKGYPRRFAKISKAPL